MSNSEKHNFWDTQPVGTGEENNIIKKPKEILSNPVPLPSGFTFTTLSIDDVNRIYELLYTSYVESDDGEYRLHYSKDFLKWQISNPWHKDCYLLGLLYNEKLIGFTMGKEHDICIRGQTNRIITVNFLCLIKEYRKKGMAQLIIQELTRIANLNGIFQALFTGGIELPFKLATIRYYHRILNIEKLIKYKFCNENYRHFCKKNQSSETIGRIAEEKDFEKILEIYNSELKHYDIYEVVGIKEIKHNLLYNNVVYTFVYEQNNVICGYGSFFILNNLMVEFNEDIKTAYLFYYGGKNKELIILDLINQAKKINCDLFNAWDVMNNDLIFNLFDFVQGDSHLNFYLYNWKAKEINRSKVGFLLP